METGLNKTYYAESLKLCSKTPCVLGDYMGVVLYYPTFFSDSSPEALINPVMKLGVPLRMENLQMPEIIPDYWPDVFSSSQVVGMVMKIVDPTL